jgi:hypothetical protein
MEQFTSATDWIHTLGHKLMLTRTISAKVLKFIRQPSFLAFVFFTLMTFVMTYPLIFRMNQILGSAGGDGTYFVWLVRWYQKAIFELKISPFFNPFMNFPQGWSLVSEDISPIMVALALPGSLLFGPTWGYNFSMLLSFILSGWGMYLWIKHLTGNDLAGLVAGMIFGFLPFRMAHVLIGHLSLAGTQWFPFYFWGLYDLLKQEKFSWKPVLMAGVSAGLIGATSPYYTYMTVLLSAVFLVGFILFKGYNRLKSPVFWKSLLLFGIVSSVLVGIAMLPYLTYNFQTGFISRPVEYLSTYSASPTDFVIPSIWQFLWGGWVEKTFNPEIAQEATLYVGAVAFILATLAWVKRHRIGHPDLLNIALLVGISAFILALGMDIHWLGRKITSLPVLLQPIFHRTDMPAIHLPAYYLYFRLPFFSAMRVMMRFGLFTLIFSSMMAGLGAHVLLNATSQKFKRWVAIGLLVLVFVDFYPGVFTQFSTLDARPVDYWLAKQPDTGAIAQFPFSDESSQGQVFNTIISQKPYLGGFFNANPPEQYLRIHPVMDEFPTAESVALLKELGVGYVVVDSTAYTNYHAIDTSIQSFGLHLLNISSEEYVYGWP